MCLISEIIPCGLGKGIKLVATPKKNPLKPNKQQQTYKKSPKTNCDVSTLRPVTGVLQDAVTVGQLGFSLSMEFNCTEVRLRNVFRS